MATGFADDRAAPADGAPTGGDATRTCQVDGAWSGSAPTTCGGCSALTPSHGLSISYSDGQAVLSLAHASARSVCVGVAFRMSRGVEGGAEGAEGGEEGGAKGRVGGENGEEGAKGESATGAKGETLQRAAG